MRIFHLGHSIKNVFPADTVLVGRHLEDIFRLVRPDILLEWSKVGSKLCCVCILQETREIVCLGTFLRSTHCICD